MAAKDMAGREIQVGDVLGVHCSVHNPRLYDVVEITDDTVMARDRWAIDQPIIPLPFAGRNAEHSMITRMYIETAAPFDMNFNEIKPGAMVLEVTTGERWVVVNDVPGHYASRNLEVMPAEKMTAEKSICFYGGMLRSHWLSNFQVIE